MSLRNRFHYEHVLLLETSVSTDDCRSGFQSTVKFVSVGKIVKETIYSLHMLWT